MHYGTCFWYVKNHSFKIRLHQFETQVTKSQSWFNYNVKNQSSSYLSIHNGTCFWHVKNRSLRIRSHQFETRVTKSQSLFNSLLQRQKTIIQLSVNAFCTSRITYSKLVYTSSKHKSLNHKVALIHCYNDKNQSSSYLSNTVTHGFWYVKNHSPKIRLHTFETQVGLKLF